MKKFFLFSLLTLLFAAGISTDADAQSRKKKKKKTSKTDQYFDEGGFKNKLWYGGGFILGFAGSGETSQFSLGLTPMVGYKIVDDLVSVGPRVGFIYNTVKGRGTDGDIHRVNPTAFSLGAFARIKPFPNFFGHLEYENERTKNFFTAGNGLLFVQNDEVVTEKVVRDNIYAGIGYNSGGLIGYEILLLYNLNEPEDSIELPIDFRFGLTYKF